MPGGRPLNTSKGDRGEYLAQYLLSFIGLPLPVLRQLDIGIDFVCNISEKKEQILTFNTPFSVQLKVLNENSKLLSNSIKFGGFNKKGNWKDYEIEWLFNPGIPLYIGILDALNRSIQLFSTSSIWFAYHHNETPTEIILEPRINEDNNEEVHSPKKVFYKFKKNEIRSGDGYVHKIDLGNPIISINIEDIKSESLLEEKKNKLKDTIIRIDQRNIVQRNLESAFFWWNKFQNSNMIAWYTNPWSPKFNVEKLKEELVPILVPMALFYKENNMVEDLNNLKQILNYIKYLVPQEIVNDHLKKIFD